MSVKFFRHGEEFDSGDCMRGLNILGHAQMIELFIGSKCGGHGECGADRVRISLDDQKKLNPPSAVEREFLRVDQLEKGFRIACQCFPNADGLSISVEIT